MEEGEEKERGENLRDRGRGGEREREREGGRESERERIKFIYT